MRRTTIGILAAVTLTVVGCGSGSTFKNDPRPPTPVDLTVYINDARVSVSPSSVGAGPVNFIVTNQSAKTESLAVAPASAQGGKALAHTGPIHPQATSEVTVNFHPGDYTVTTGTTGATDASRALPTAIHPASLHIGKPRPNADNVLLQP
jgi:hypothetical protein